MKVERAIGLFDSLISPIALYAFQFWSVLSLPASSFNTMENLLNSWGKFLPGTLNQKCCSNRTPLLITSLFQSMKYN